MEEELKELVLQFHNTYEELAPKYGYETRKDTREFDFNSNNGKLMYATIEKIVKPILNRLEQLEKAERVINDVASHLEYYLIGRLDLKDSQEEFKKLLKMLKQD